MTTRSHHHHPIVSSPGIPVCRGGGLMVLICQLMSFPLALQPVAREDTENASLQDLVRRINEERGAFRSITEEQLKEEITNDLASQKEDTNVAEEKEAPQDLEKRRKELFSARNQMLQFIG